METGRSRLGTEGICGELHIWFNSLKRFAYPFEVSEIPLNGIYVVFEKGETAHGVDRIVRVGTHTGRNQLRSRLEQHFVKENKDRSIFRKNVGRALINKKGDANLLRLWEIDRTPKENRKLTEGEDFSVLKEVEREVSDYMRKNLGFAVFEVGPKEERLFLESRLISTISLCTECGPSSSWLGNFSTKEKIRGSGMWLVNELYKTPFSEKEADKLALILGVRRKTVKSL